MANKSIPLLILIIFTMLLSPHYSDAQGTEIPCVGGKCDGWRIWLDEDFNDKAIININNETGIIAYNIKVTIAFYNNFDELIGRGEYENKGPIREYMKYPLKLSNKFDHADCIVDWNDKP